MIMLLTRFCEKRKGTIPSNATIFFNKFLHESLSDSEISLPLVSINAKLFGILKGKQRLDEPAQILRLTEVRIHS